MSLKKEIKILLRLLFRREYSAEIDLMEYRIPNVPVKKIINYCLIQINRFFEIPKVLGKPYKLQVEPMRGCNLKCPGCPANKKNSRQRAGPLSLELFKKFIHQTEDCALFLTLWSWGEPFLNKNLPEMIRYAKSKNIAVVTSTNANLLLNKEYNERVLKSGLDNLIVAVDGASPETYGIYRKGGDFARVVKGIRLLVSQKKKLGLEKPAINLRMVVTSYNEHEIKEIRQLAGKLGVDALTLKSVNPSLDSETVNLSLIPKNKKYHRYEFSEETGAIKKQERFKCTFPWAQTTMFSDGTIAACEADVNASVKFGNLLKESFGSIWFGRKAENFRKQFVKKKEAFRFCEKCSYRNMIIGSCTVEKVEI